MVFKYLQCTLDYVICYQGRFAPHGEIYIHGFVDVDWVRDLNHEISTSGYVFNLFGEAIMG
jgi:hypothetical protein